MKLPWRISLNGKGKIKKDDTSAATVPAAPKPFLSVLRLKKFFGNGKRGVHQQKNPDTVKDFPGVGALSTSSCNHGSLSVVPVISGSSHVSLPLETSIEAVDILKSDDALPPVTQSGLCDHPPKFDPAGDASSVGSAILQRIGGVLSLGVSSNASDSDARYGNICIGWLPEMETSWTTDSVDSGMPVMVHTADEESHNKEGRLTCRAQNGGKPTEYKPQEEPLSREEHLVPVAENATSNPGKLAQYTDQIMSSSKGRSYASVKDSIDLVGDTGGQENKIAKHQSQSKVCSFASLRRQANFSSPARCFVEDLTVYGRPVLSVRRWETVNQVPQTRPGHARVLSGTTIANTDNSQGRTPPPQLKTLQFDEPLSIRGQPVDESKNKAREETEDGALIDINAISPDVQWETILESRQTSHENEMADLVEDHAAEIQELRELTTEQVRLVKNELTSALRSNKQLKKKNAELRRRRNRQVEQLQHNDMKMQQVLADHRGLQHRFEQCEMDLLQLKRTDAPGVKVVNENASLERITALAAQVHEKDQLLRVAHDMNYGLAAALAKDKAEAEFYAEKVYELTGRLEDKPASDTEKDRLLEYKDKMYKDLDIRCSEITEGLQLRVQDLEKQTELDKACSSGAIIALQNKLDRMTRADQDLAARKLAFKRVDKLIFEMLRRPQDNTRALRSMDEINRLVHSDNDYLRGISEAKEMEICDAEVEASQLRTAIRELRKGEDMKARTISTLEERTRAQACELGRLQTEADILLVEHEEALANKNRWISHYKQKAEISDQEKNTFINTRLDHWVRWSLQGKDREISRLENEVSEQRSTGFQLRHELQKMTDCRTHDAGYAYVSEQESQLNKERTRAAEEEVRTLQIELSDLRECYHSIQKEEDKGIKEVLKEGEELQEAESREEMISLNARLEQGTI